MLQLLTSPPPPPPLPGSHTISTVLPHTHPCVEVDHGEGGGNEAVCLDGLVLLLLKPGDALDVVAYVGLGGDEHTSQQGDEHAYFGGEEEQGVDSCPGCPAETL